MAGSICRDAICHRRKTDYDVTVTKPKQLVKRLIGSDDRQMMVKFELSSIGVCGESGSITSEWSALEFLVEWTKSEIPVLQFEECP